MGAACAGLQDQITGQIGASFAKPSDGKDPKSVPLSGEPFQRLKENFEAPFGETYDINFTKEDWQTLGIELITDSGPCLQLLITYVTPFKVAHKKGVAPGTRIVKVNGAPPDSLQTLFDARDALGDSESMTMTFERPAWGYVVAKTGEFVGKPTISTYTAMGIDVNEIPEKFGKERMVDLNFAEICYFHEVGQRMIHMAVNTPGWGEEGAARLFDAPYWEKDCMEDAEFQSNFNKLKNTDQGKQVWCPMKCDEVGLPLNLSEMTHPRGHDEMGFAPMSARFGFIDDLVTSDIDFWKKYIGLNLSMEKIRHQSASSANTQTKNAIKHLKGKVYYVPEHDYKEERRGLLTKYWSATIAEVDDASADLWVSKVDEEAEEDGEWQIVDSKEEADFCVYVDNDARFSAHFWVRYVKDTEYWGLSPPGCAAGKMFYEQTHDNRGE